MHVGNLTHRMECFPDLLDLFHMPIRKKPIKVKGEEPSRKHVKGDWLYLLSVTLTAGQSDFFSTSGAS